MIIMRLAVPPYQRDAGTWLDDPGRRNAVRVAVQLAPFAGIAFLWFIGVIRNRIGRFEDQFFATVFLGSGLLFVASLFVSAALTGALVEVATRDRVQVLNPDLYVFARQLIGVFANIFGIKMAGVFLMSTSTIFWRTRILPRWVSLGGFACAVALLAAITSWPWIALVFPLWMLVLSLSILIADLSGGWELRRA